MNPEKQPRRSRFGRTLSSLALGAALLALIGDRAHTAGIGGIDPLEVLNLSVKPNVIVVIDSSGSMGRNLYDQELDSSFRGDWPDSKMFLAKQVLKQVIQTNESKVSFLFGQYTQSGSDFQNDQPGQNRFFYTTTSTQSPSMTTTELSLTRTSTSDTTTRGHQAWQDIRSGWNTLYYGEQISATTVVAPSIVIDATNNKFVWREAINLSSTANYTYITCTVVLPPALYGTYSTDAEIGLPIGMTPTSGLFAQINTFTVAGGPVAGRTCVRTGPSAGGPEPTQPLRFVWTGAPQYQVRIEKGAFVAPATGASRIQIIRDSASVDILDNFGFPNSIPNSALTPSSAGNRSTTSVCNSSSGSNWTSCASFTGPNAIGGSSTSTSVVVCAVPVASQFYQTGPALATALQTAMNSCGGRGSTPNVYAVTFSNSSGAFTFSTGGANSFQMRWADTPSNIAGALGSPSSPNTGLSTSSKVSGNSIRLLNRATSDDTPLDGAGVRHYFMRASRFFNGETFSVLSDGTLCAMSAPTPTNPPSIKLALRTTCGSADDPANTVTFTYAGPSFGGNSVSCDGFQTKVNLQPCNTAASQFTTIAPFLELQIPLTPDGLALSPAAYSETPNNGSWNTAVVPPAGPGIVADGSTPIANSIDDIRTLFNGLWTSGQNPGPPVLPAISTQSPPQERTIVMFVTDGDDTCSGSGDTAARVAAYSAQQLYDPIVGGVQSPSGFLTVGSNPASSVSTYVVGFGSGASANRLNWIAWGGSGMTRATSGTPAGWTTSPTAGDRANCATCQDAFIAPDAATLTAALQAIIDQGATSGSFTAQQSIVASVFEMVGEVSGFSPNAPKTRYDAIVPIQFQASFDLPGFQGRLKAIQFDAACAAFPSADARCVNTASFAKWEAGQRLLDRVTNGPAGNNGMNQITPLRTGALAGQGTFSQLHGGATDSTIGASAAGLKRRIYTTTRNGSFALDSSAPILNANLGGLTSAPISPNRTPLWPPTTAALPTAVAPASDTVQGVLDVALGLPAEPITAGTAPAQFAALQATFKACRGVTLPANCLAGAGAIAQARRARREAREMILAYTAGGLFVPDIPGDPARVTAGTEVGEILYKARNWVLAESTLAPPAIVASPISIPPSAYKTEYANYADGVSSAGIKPNGVTQGFGLANPDLDNSTTLAPPTPPIDTAHSATQRAVMTVAYVGANDMLHAFRAGPNCGTPGGVGLTATYAACAEKGGEELWGFVPFDRLIALKALMQPQTRQNKTYVIGAALRFADVFIDTPPFGASPASSITASVGAVPLPGACAGKPCGLWRQLLTFGRGPGGKFMTTLDISNRGPYTGLALASQAPIVLWSRGNPDTQDGTPGGTVNNNAADKAAYDKMGETWSTPAVVYVDRAKNVTARRPFNAGANSGGVPMVAYMGSGYCSPCNAGEGTTFFTLDITSGDVVAAVDVEVEAANAGVQRAGLPYANALVSSPAAYSASGFDPLQPGHPADPTTRVYIGDLHGRLWKFLSIAPDQALLMADLGADQPIGTAPALLGLSGDGIEPSAPFVFVTSGNDSRATGTFKIFGFKDGGDDSSATYGSATPTSDPAVSIYSPTLFQFARTFGDPPLPNFRGTIQPATALSSNGLGRVFFGGTRFNLPGSPEAPPPPPCRSSFDSIIFALGAVTGGAAYDLNSSGDDAYMLFTNSRKTAIQIIKQPTPTGAPPGTKGKGMLMIDEGLMGSGSVQPPPPLGLQPQIPAAPNVGLVTTDAQGNAFPQFTSPRLCQGQ